MPMNDRSNNLLFPNSIKYVSFARVKASYPVFIILLFLPLISIAKDESEKTKRLSIFPFPVISYTPETDFLFGAGGSFTFRFKDEPLNARPSNIFAGGAYTLNKQILLYTNYKLFYDENKYYAYGEVGYYNYNFFYYGIGENRVPEELFSVDFPRVITDITRKVLPNLYSGVRYHYENYQVHDQIAGGELISGNVPGGMGSVVSGAGVTAVYDSRDSVFYPNKGWYSEVYYTNYGNTWGGNFNYNRVAIDIANYQKISKKVIVALNSFSSFISGTAPFQQLSGVGGTKKMRGFYEGFFRDKNMSMLQAETRFPIWWRFGGVVFGDVGVLGDNATFLRFDKPKYTYGGGLRFTITKKDHLNIRFDYGIGPGTSGAYITIGEAF